jgi:hypothetical protein
MYEDSDQRVLWMMRKALQNAKPSQAFANPQIRSDRQ